MGEMEARGNGWDIGERSAGKKGGDEDSSSEAGEECTGDEAGKVLFTHKMCEALVQMKVDGQTMPRFSSNLLRLFSSSPAQAVYM